MREVHAGPVLADAYVIRDVLRGEGIPADIRNEHIVGTTGSGTVTPEEWVAVVVPDGDVARARFLLREHLRDDDAALALENLAVSHSDTPGGEDAQIAMAELFVAAGRLAHDPRRGRDIEEVLRLAPVLATTPAPFGVEVRTWEAAARWAMAIADSAASGTDDALQEQALRLRDTLERYV